MTLDVRQVRDQAGAGSTHLLDGPLDPHLGVVVVVADRNRPRHLGCIFGTLGHVVVGERIVVDGSSH